MVPAVTKVHWQSIQFDISYNVSFFTVIMYISFVGAFPSYDFYSCLGLSDYIYEEH